MNIYITIIMILFGGFIIYGIITDIITARKEAKRLEEDFKKKGRTKKKNKGVKDGKVA